MATLEVDLRDSEGTPVDFGDTVQAFIPGLELPGDYSDPFYMSDKVIEGILRFRLSEGLMIRITRIVDPGEPDSFSLDPLKPGRIIKFKTRRWTWKLIKKAEKITTEHRIMEITQEKLEELFGPGVDTEDGELQLRNGRVVFRSNTSVTLL